MPARQIVFEYAVASAQQRILYPGAHSCVTITGGKQFCKQAQGPVYDTVEFNKNHGVNL